MGPEGALPMQNGLKRKRVDELYRSRSTLPIYAHASTIRRSLRDDVLILVGETGSGKSTQVPQFLLTEAWCKGMIAVTEPRRVAAISLARRVASEMGTTLGASAGPASKVGYSVRFDTNVARDACKIKFLTEGMLLQEMLSDPFLKKYSAVIVDEVHERGLDCDMILGFLRRIVCSPDGLAGKGMPREKMGRLKVVVMSATADVQKLVDFFELGFDSGLTSSTSSSNIGHEADSDSSWDGFASSQDSETDNVRPVVNGSGKRPNGNPTVSREAAKKKPRQSPVDHVATCYIEGRQHPVEILYLPSTSSDWTEDALKTVFHIHHSEPLPGDILVFCTGQSTIELLEKLINELVPALKRDVPNILVLPLFASLPQHAQQLVFQATPPRTRKIILATNIAETSVTIPGVRFVIDCGLAKMKEFRSQIGLDSLLVKSISKSSAIQRKGRAGREGPGKCYRLYTEQEYLKLEPATVPEILRCDVATAILNMKARGVEHVLDFPFLDPPDIDSMRRATVQLIRLGALKTDSSITPNGRLMAGLPLSPSLACVLIEAATGAKNCILPVIDTIAALSVESIFLNLGTEEKREQASVARRELLRRQGDHLTLAATVQAYAVETSGRKAWCNARLVSHRAMRNVMDVRKQLRAQCVRQKLLDQSALSDAWVVETDEAAAQVLRCFVRGFVTNTARLMPDGSYKTNDGNHTIAIHPASVLYGKKVEAIVYNEFVFTSRSYARGVSAIETGWYVDAMTASA